jgi:phosphatidylserine/phosphatidylglycerophosphate/cardiolipin synthase-like enzyme
MSTPQPAGPQPDSLSVRFLSQGAQTAESIAELLVGFINGAAQSLDFATYDFRLSEPLAAMVHDALAQRQAAGVTIRIAYDSDKTQVPPAVAGVDPSTQGTGVFLAEFGFPAKPIAGLKLMHNKYIIRDALTPGAMVWTGSTNLTDDAWTLQENNIVTLTSPTIAGWYREDLEEMWASGEIGNSGDFETRVAPLQFAGQPASAQVFFSPGMGEGIDYLVAHRVAAARRRIRICSMLLNSGTFLNALLDQLRRGTVPMDGIYDRTQMADVITQWEQVPSNHWKIGALSELVSGANLVGKNSTHYTPTSVHDFMHNKVLVVDDTVITGSYNFSRSAELNAENILFITSPALANQYSAYIDTLKAKYG